MSMEKFHHRLDDGREIVLPHFKNLPFGLVRRLRKADEAEQMFQLVEEVSDEGTLAVLDSLPMAEIEKVFTAWQKASGVTAGESSASSSS